MTAHQRKAVLTSASAQRATSLWRNPMVRVLTAMTITNNFGNGLFLATSALFYTRYAGLTVAQVGLGLALAGACGIVGGMTFGQLSDRLGARRMMIWLVLAEGLGFLCYTQVHSFIEFLPLVCLVAFVDRGGMAVRGAFIMSALPRDIRVQSRAFMRAATNVGLSIGSAAAAIVIEANTPRAYLIMIVINAVTFLLNVIPWIWMPALAASGEKRDDAGGSRRQALTDVPYLAVTALNAIFAMQTGVLVVGLPLWVVRATHAPRVFVSAAFVLNTALVVVLQVRASRGMDEPGRAARACARAGVLLAASCTILGLASRLAELPATGLLLGAVLLLTAGELLSAAGGWGLSYELADERAPGRYQGVFFAGFAAGTTLGPLAVTHSGLQFGIPGWLVLGALFLAAGLAMVPATRWALARRNPATPS